VKVIFNWFIILFFVVYYNVNAQTLEYGPYQNYKTNNSSVIIAGETDKEIIAYQKIKRTFQLRIQSISVYGYEKQNLQLKWTKEIKLTKGILAKFNFHSILALKDEIYIVLIASNNSKTKIYLASINNYSLPIALKEVNFTQPDKISLCVNTDKNTFSLACLAYNKNEILKDMSISVFNDSLKTIFTEEKELP
jgi:hypothetical protein